MDKLTFTVDSKDVVDAYPHKFKKYVKIVDEEDSGKIVYETCDPAIIEEMHSKPNFYIALLTVQHKALDNLRGLDKKYVS